MESKVELMNLFWTTSGMFPGKGEISPHDFRHRVQSAARAGFNGIGLWHTDLEHLLVYRTLKEIKQILDDNGVRHLELESLPDRFLEGARKRESDNHKRRLLEASEALGAHHIKVAGAPNGGLVLDITHMVNLGIPFTRMRGIPAERLISLELNDGTLPGTPGHDPSLRRFCGEGKFDIKSFIECGHGAGYTGPWALEVFNREFAGLPLDELNTRAYETTIAQFTS